MKKKNLNEEFNYNTSGEYLVLLPIMDNKPLKYEEALSNAAEMSKKYGCPLYICMVITRVDYSDQMVFQHTRLLYQLEGKKTKRYTWKHFVTTVFQRLKK